jgi:hypothetical protein
VFNLGVKKMFNALLNLFTGVAAPIVLGAGSKTKGLSLLVAGAVAFNYVNKDQALFIIGILLRVSYTDIWIFLINIFGLVMLALFLSIMALGVYYLFIKVQKMENAK